MLTSLGPPVARRGATEKRPSAHHAYSRYPGQTQTSVAFRTIGCKLNQCETAQMQQTLLAEGFRLVDWDEPADVRVINTCTVTAKSDRTCRHEIHLAKRLDPDCVVAVTGCYAQVDPDTVSGHLRSRPGAGQHREAAAGRAIDRGAGPGRGSPSATTGASPASAATTRSRRPFDSPRPPDSRASSSLTSTATPAPSSRCRPAATRAAPTASSRWREVRRAACPRPSAAASAPAGRPDFREVVLTGINLGSWGRDTEEGGSPTWRPPALSRDAGSPLPLQFDRAPGGERRAPRRHRASRGADRASLPPALAERLRSGAGPNEPAVFGGRIRCRGTAIWPRFPDAALGADVIVGFPGETDASSTATCDFVEHFAPHLPTCVQLQRPSRHGPRR